MKIGVIDGVLVKNKITKFANVIKYGIFNGKVENIKDEKISYNMTHSTSCCVALQNFLRNPSKHSLLPVSYTHLIPGHMKERRPLYMSISCCINRVGKMST